MILLRSRRLFTPALSFLSKYKNSDGYASLMYKAWTADRASVPLEWNQYFSNNQIETSSHTSVSREQTEKQKDLVLNAFKLIRYYELRGHELATLDPLNLQDFAEFGRIYKRNPQELNIKKNFKDSDLDIPFRFPQDQVIVDRTAAFIAKKPTWTLREINQKLQEIYCGKIGFEYMHIINEQEKVWLMKKFEEVSTTQLSKERKLHILEDLNRIEVFNSFLAQKLQTSKRFGVEGCDTVISGLNALVEEAAKNGVEYVGFGMAHRGRLNALANVFKKPMQKIFSEFLEQTAAESEGAWGNSGDVKYHLGVSNTLDIQGNKIRLSILANPSHLETVNPVLMGNVRAVRDVKRDEDGSKAMGVLIHGDAALAGQGIVYESLQMESLRHYKISGVVHVVANNQIGFTTTPAQARTGQYCTDVAKSILSPIIHVNADDPQMVDKAMRVAFEYRKKFQKDVFVDIIGYRRFGHNEQDQPAFTQPMMYQNIANHARVYQLYSNKLVAEGVITKEQKKKLWDQEISRINDAYTESQNTDFDIKKWTPPTFNTVVDLSTLGTIKNTGVAPDTLKQLGKIITTIPENFVLHPQIAKIYEERRKNLEHGSNIDYGTAESLAFATLLKEGFNVRFSGQDVERGTFSHRHAVVNDQVTGAKLAPIRNLLKPEEYYRFSIENSHLSEYACLGYEVGYSTTNPNTLCVWEAQFGDFANGAQIIIDNYLSSGESKWGVQTGVIVNLPHGMDGQGPEHSSGRMERFLQLVSDEYASIVQERKERIKRQIKNGNMQVINCSFAANYFHALRRQMRRDFRKPLINFVSKKLLKYKPAMSTYELFNDGYRFFTIMPEAKPDTLVAPEQVKKVLIVSGQAYYSLIERREELKANNIAIIRVEQIAPFPYDYFKKTVQPYKNAEFIWFQEEHKNSGAWTYLYPRISLILEELKKEGSIMKSEVKYVGRKVSPSTAAGKKKKHDYEQEEILQEVFA